MSVDVIIILIIVSVLYPTSSINVVKRDLSSFHCVENITLSLRCSKAYREIVLSVAVRFFCFFFREFLFVSVLEEFQAFCLFPLFNNTSNTYQVCCYLLLLTVQVLPLHKYLFLKDIAVFNVLVFSVI